MERENFRSNILKTEISDLCEASQNIEKIHNSDRYVKTKQRARLVSPTEQEIFKMKSCADNTRQKETDARKDNTMLASGTQKSGLGIHFQVELNLGIDIKQYI